MTVHEVERVLEDLWADLAPWPTADDLVAELDHMTSEAFRLAEKLHAAEAEVAAMRGSMTEATPPMWQLDDAGLLVELAAAQKAATVAHARWLAVLAEADRRGVVEREHHMPTNSWLAAGTSHSTRTARADVRLAESLTRHEHVATALGEGRMSVEQAATIVVGLDRLPDDLDPVTRDAVEAQMVDYAGEFNPTALRRLVNHAIDVVAPEVAEEHNGKLLDRAEREQARTRHLAWRTDPDDGSLRFWGKLPALDGELFKQHLSAIATRSRLADAAMGIDTAPGQALADALALVLSHHASCDGGPAQGGDHTRVIVTMDLDALLSGLGAGTLLEGGEPISAGQARRLACTHGIIPAILNSDSVPLDLGRTQRFFTPAQRLALALRDGGCAFPGCDRPPSDCEAHHAKEPWHQGGRTDLADGVLLCPHHHHLVEPDPHKPPEKNWQITLDHRGKPQFHTPQNRTGHRTTRQHHRYRC